MIGQLIDITNKKFGRWTVLEINPQRASKGDPGWLCKCECGTVKVVNGQSLRQGRSKSCGCIQKGQKSISIIDLTGQKFGRWTVISASGEKAKVNRSAKWLCRCECGNERNINGSSLRSGRSSSCGCFHNEKVKESFTKHGKYKTPEYEVWRAMKQRCLNPSQPYYPYYGGRGITICKRWLDSFENFIADMGPRPTSKHSIDRKNNNLGYSPDNCRWATASQQNANKRPYKRKAKSTNVNCGNNARQ